MTSLLTSAEMLLDGARPQPAAVLTLASVGRTDHARTLRVRVTVGRRVRARVRLVRGGAVLSERRWARLAPGKHVLRVRLPREVVAGSADVVVDLTEPGRTTEPATWRVHVPAGQQSRWVGVGWWPQRPPVPAAILIQDRARGQVCHSHDAESDRS